MSIAVGYLLLRGALVLAPCGRATSRAVMMTGREYPAP